MTIDSESEISIDNSISSSLESEQSHTQKVHEKQLVSEIADASEDNKDDL